MGTRKNRTKISLALFLILGSGAAPLGGQEYEEYPIEARVWLDRGHEPVLQRGERVRLYYRSSEDAFVAIFHIDTNGTTRLVFPSSPQENHYARAGRDYRVLFPGSTYWYVGDDPGMGYFFIVASPEPFDFSELRYSHYDGGWDLGFVGRNVYQDPYLAMDDYVGALIPDWEYIPYGLDFTAYHVERRYEYPRFMCYDCHGFRPYNSWNPYHYSCTSFRVVIYNDPYYYPVTRYRGTRVVYVQPRRGIAHFGFKERAVGEPSTPHVVVRKTPPATQPGVAGTANRRSQSKESAGRTGANVRGPDRSSGGAARSTPPGVAGSAARRPTGSTPGTSNGRSAPPGATSGTRGGTTATPRTTPPGTPSRSGITNPRAPGRPIVTPPVGGARARPSTSGQASAGAGARTGSGVQNSGSRVARPSGRTGGSGSATRPTVRGGGSSGSTRSTVRSGGSSGAGRPTVRSGDSGARPSVRSSGGSSSSAAKARSGGGSNSRPTVRSSGASSRSSAGRAKAPAASRPTVRSGGSSKTTRPTVRSGGSGGASRSQPARRTSRPPARKKSGGG